MHPDVTGILDLPEDAFAKLVRRLFAAQPEQSDIELLQCLRAYVLADEHRRARWALRLSALDPETRRAIWTPARLASVMARLAEEADLALPEDSSAEATAALEVLWSEGGKWVRASLAALRAWLTGLVEQLDCQPVELETAQYSVEALRLRTLRGDGGGAGESERIRMQIRGHDIDEDDSAALRLEADPLRVERCSEADMKGLPGWRVRGGLRLHVGDTSMFQDGVLVLLVSDDPVLALNATVMPSDETVLSGEVDNLLVLRDAPAQLSRDRFQALLWRVPRRPSGRRRKRPAK